MDHALNHTNFCMYDNNVHVKTVYVKVVEGEESKYRVEQSCFIDRNVLYLSSSLGKSVLRNLSTLEDVR